MNSSRKRAAVRQYTSERIVGETQWNEGRGATLGEFMASAVVWAAVGLGFVLAVRGWVFPWLEAQARDGEWTRGGSAAAVLCATLLAVVTWAWLSARLSRLRRRGAGLAWGVPVVLSVGAVAVLWAWIDQGWGAEKVTPELGGRFAFGTSLTRSLMTRLKREGYVGIVSLLYPSEADGSEGAPRASAWAREMDMTMVDAPLHPERELDTGSLDVLARVAREGGGRWFVHGGADTNRLQMARRLLTRMTGSPELLPDRLTSVGALERGPVLRLEEDVFLTPFPTDHEFLTLYLEGSVRSVLSLLDPSDPADRDWLDRESPILTRLGIGLHAAPVREEPFDPFEVVDAVETARALPRPLVVQSFLTPSVRSEAFGQAWPTGVPPLPIRLFTEPLQGGEARVVVPNVAVGPPPVGREFRTLFNRGVRRVLRVGGDRPATIREEQALSREAGLDWHEPPADTEALLLELARGGPWYVYGSGAEELVERIAGRQAEPPPRGPGAARDTGGARREAHRSTSPAPVLRANVFRE